MTNYRMGDRVIVVGYNPYDIAIGTQAVVISEMTNHPGWYVLAWPNFDPESTSCASHACPDDALAPTATVDPWDPQTSRLAPYNALGRISALAEANATTAHALGRNDERRRWLDITAIIERAKP